MPRFGGAVFVCPISLPVIGSYKSTDSLPHRSAIWRCGYTAGVSEYTE